MILFLNFNPNDTFRTVCQIDIYWKLKNLPSSLESVLDNTNKQKV